MHPSLSLADVKAFRVSRVRHVFALPTLGYSDRLPPTVTSVPGLYSLNSAHIVNGTLNVNETIKLANDFVAGLASGNMKAPMTNENTQASGRASALRVAEPAM
jgi:hypothetical protein